MILVKTCNVKIAQTHDLEILVDIDNTIPIPKGINCHCLIIYMTAYEVFDVSAHDLPFIISSLLTFTILISTNKYIVYFVYINL